jgi:uncharacterized protein YcbX
MFKKYEMDGFVSQSLSDTPDAPSSVLSKYLGRPAHLAYKGPRPRPCSPTIAFPELNTTVSYQDGYPLLFLSEESVTAVETQVRGYVGVQGVGDKWETEPLVIERYGTNVHRYRITHRRRFRPNIVLRGGGPFIEDTWREIAICSQDGGGVSPVFSLVSVSTRCLVRVRSGSNDRPVLMMVGYDGTGPERRPEDWIER